MKDQASIFVNEEGEREATLILSDNSDRLVQMHMQAYNCSREMAEKMVRNAAEGRAQVYKSETTIFGKHEELQVVDAEGQLETPERE